MARAAAIGVDDRATSAPTEATIWQRFAVSYDFPVVFGRGLLSPANSLLAQALARREPEKRHRCLVALDAGLIAARPDLPDLVAAYAAAHADRMALAGAPLILPGGEAAKIDPNVLEQARDAIHAQRIDRHSFVLAIGGGALLDAVGFAAATAHRGVRLVRMPTTTLGQNDSGVGVKNAVNFRGVKNYSGAFAPPWAVLNDFDFLDALPRRERAAGLAEAVKVALIRDAGFFHWLEDNAPRLARFERSAEEEMIRRCAGLHMRQIGQGGDPFETGSARPLDFGHWSAHKLEALAGYDLRHGEAVAVGIALDARISTLAGLLRPGLDARIAALIEALGLPLWRAELARREEDGRLAVLGGLEDFREHLGGSLTVTLLRDLGVGVEVGEVGADLVEQAVGWLVARAGA